MRQRKRIQISNHKAESKQRNVSLPSEQEVKCSRSPMLVNKWEVSELVSTSKTRIVMNNLKKNLLRQTITYFKF